MSSQVKMIPVEQLRPLHTGRLLALLKKLHQCEESFKASDRYYDGEAEPDPAITGFIEFKDTPAWKQAYLELKSVLKDREHLPRPAERKLRRERRAKRNCS